MVRKTEEAVSETRLQTSIDYPLWHGSTPMALFLEHRLRPSRFLVEGAGARVRDASGRWLLDARSSCWNLGLGYSAQRVKDAIRDQLDMLPNATLLAYDRPPEVTVRYAQMLRDAFDPALPYVRLGNTGSQMTETAVMLSRFTRMLEGNTSRMAVLSFEGSYHGLGIGGNALSGSVANFDFCGPLAPAIHHISPYGSWTANVRKKLDELSADQVTAVIVEPQMGSLGLIPDNDDLRELAELCQLEGVHFIADEVTTGFGRTGAMSRCLDLGIRPDIITLGKNMTSGYFPIAALLVSAKLYAMAADPKPPRFLPAGSATDGHPVGAAAGVAVLEIYQQDHVVEHARSLGESFQRRLRAVHDVRIGTGEVRGAGLMQLFPLLDDTGSPWPGPQKDRFRQACEDSGVLVSMSAHGAWLCPPLISTEGDCEEIVIAMEAALDAVRSGSGGAEQ